MGIQDRLIEKRIHKAILSHKGLKQNQVLLKLQKIFVFIDEETTFNYEEFRYLRAKLQLDETHFTFLTYKQKPSTINEFRGAVVLRNAINWQGNIKTKEVKSLLDANYDLLLDYTTADTIYKQLILSKVKALLKVGYMHENAGLYDFMIDVSRKDIRVFNDELLRYLSILGVLEVASNK